MEKRYRNKIIIIIKRQGGGMEAKEGWVGPGEGTGRRNVDKRLVGSTWIRDR